MMRVLRFEGLALTASPRRTGTLSLEPITAKLADEVELQYYRLERIHTGPIDLRQGDVQAIKSPTDVGTSRTKDEKAPLSEIIQVLNERFGTQFTEEDRLFLPLMASPGLTFDGKGNLTQLDAVAVNGNVAPGWASNTGTYSVNPDCTGTFTVTNGSQPPVHLQMIVAQSGNTIHDMVIDPGFATTAEADRIRVPRD